MAAQSLIAGHLQEKKGYFYVVLNIENEDGNRTPKWFKTGLSVKGNKKRAERMLNDMRREYTAYRNSKERNALKSAKRKRGERQRSHSLILWRTGLKWQDVP